MSCDDPPGRWQTTWNREKKQTKYNGHAIRHKPHTTRSIVRTRDSSTTSSGDHPTIVKPVCSSYTSAGLTTCSIWIYPPVVSPCCKLVCFVHIWTSRLNIGLSIRSISLDWQVTTTVEHPLTRTRSSDFTRRIPTSIIVLPTVHSPSTSPEGLCL